MQKSFSIQKLSFQAPFPLPAFTTPLPPLPSVRLHQPPFPPSPPYLCPDSDLSSWVVTRARVGFRARVTDIDSAQHMLGMQVKGIPSLNTDADDLYDILSRVALVMLT